MAAENENTSHVSSQVMELKDLISGPLVATIDADTISARRYLSYLFELAFEKYDHRTGKAGPLRMLEFSYQSQDVDGIKTQKIRIPLLTLVPLPLLQVQEADFDFDIQIIDALQADRNSTFSLANPDDNDMDGQESENSRTEGLKLRVTMAQQTNENAQTTSQSSMTANMKVSVKMRQADMPGGLTKLLQLTTNSVLSEESNNHQSSDANIDND